jgi:hypothetical protein
LRDRTLGSSDAGAKINIAKTGVYDINGNWNILNPSSVGSIVNAGVFAKTFGGKIATIDASLNSTGTIKAQIGTLLLNGVVNAINGTVSGGGTLGIAGGQTTFGSKLSLTVAAVEQQSGILVLNKALSYAGEWDLTGGVLNLNSTAATLTLTGQTDLDGGTLTSFGGALLLDGPAHVGNVTIGGPTNITIGSASIHATLYQSNTITFGLSSNPTATITAGSSWVIEGDSSIIGFYGLISNNGTFSDINGSGDALVQPQLVSTGTIIANNSTLTLAGQNDLGGLLTGSGLIELAGPTYLESGLVANVAGLTVDNSYVQIANNLSYNGAFAETGNNADLLIAGTLTLGKAGTASFDSGLLSFGAVSAAGATVVGNFSIGGNADLIITGAAEQTGQLNLLPFQGPGTLTVATGASYTLDDDLSISGGGVLAIGGTFTASGTGLSQIYATVAQTGALETNDQTLSLGGGGSFAGTLGGSGTLQFTSFNGTATYTLMGLALTVAGWEVGQNSVVDVLANETYGGLFQESGTNTIELSGHTLTLSGTASLGAGTISGAGTLLSSGSGTFAGITLVGGAVLDVTANAEQSATIFVGAGANGQMPPDKSMLVIAAGATYTLDENSSIDGNGTLSVAGTLAAVSDGLSQIGPTLVDTGMITANLGTLQIISAVGGSGAFSIGTSGVLEFAANSTITVSNTISFTTGGGHLQVDNPANFAALLAHFSTGDYIDLPTFDAIASSGTLSWNAGDTVLTVSDSNHDSTTFTFTTAQTPSAFHYVTDGVVAAVMHS